MKSGSPMRGADEIKKVWAEIRTKYEVRLSMFDSAKYIDNLQIDKISSDQINLEANIELNSQQDIEHLINLIISKTTSSDTN